MSQSDVRQFTIILECWRCKKAAVIKRRSIDCHDLVNDIYKAGFDTVRVECGERYFCSDCITQIKKFEKEQQDALERLKAGRL